MLRYFANSWKGLVAHFMTGLLVVLPFLLTAAIVFWVTGFIRDAVGPDTVVGRMLASLGMRLGFDGALGYAMGIAIVLLGLVFLGIIANRGAKKLIQDFVDRVLIKVPLVGSLYGSLKQLVGMLEPTDETKLKSMSVVYCYFGSKGSAGVLALLPSPDPITVDGNKFYAVIIPTAPVPFGGGLIFFPEDAVLPVDMSVDNLVSIYVSMGASTKQIMDQLEARLQDANKSP